MNLPQLIARIDPFGALGVCLSAAASALAAPPPAASAELPQPSGSVSLTTPGVLAPSRPPTVAPPVGPAGVSGPVPSANSNVPPAAGPIASDSLERISLDAAIQRALRRNPTAQVAALDIERADALVRQARAASLPSLNGNATYTRLDHDRMFGNRLVAAKDQFNANLSLSVPLIAPGKWVQWSHAKDDANVLRLSSNEARRQLAIAVARSYLTVVSQHRVVEVNERALETARAHARYSAERLAGGLGRRIDAVRASQQVAGTQASVERSRVALRRAMEALGVLLGSEHPIDVAVEPELGGTPDQLEAKAGTESRLDVGVARARRRSAESKFRDSWTEFLPQLTGQFTPFYQTPATLTMPTTGWQAMLMLTVPLYDGGSRYGARAERRALWEQADLNLQGLLRQARSEVRIAFEAQRGAETALAAAREAAELANQAQQMAVRAYEAGALTNIEVIDAERQARDAATEVAIAEDALRQARLDLLIASGRFPVPGSR